MLKFYNFYFIIIKMITSQKSSKGGKICLYCFLVIAAILGIVAFVLTLTRKCDDQVIDTEYRPNQHGQLGKDGQHGYSLEVGKNSKWMYRVDTSSCGNIEGPFVVNPILAETPAEMGTCIPIPPHDIHNAKNVKPPWFFCENKNCMYPIDMSICDFKGPVLKNPLEMTPTGRGGCIPIPPQDIQKAKNAKPPWIFCENN